MARPPARFSLPQTLKVIVFSASLAGGLSCSSSNEPINDSQGGLVVDGATDVVADLRQDPMLDLIQDLVADSPQDMPVDVVDIVETVDSREPLCFPQGDAGANTTCPNVSYSRCSPGCNGYCITAADAGAGTDCGNGPEAACPEGCRLEPAV
jgi:hypothetical protein